MNTISFQQNISIVRPEHFFITGLTDTPYSTYFYIFLFIIYFISIIGNSIVILIIALHRSLHSPMYIGVFNLALADIGESNALIPNMMKNFLSDSQYMSYNACLANMFFVNFFITVQTCTLVVLAFDRFIAICLPLRYNAIVNNKFMAIVFSVIWAFNTFMVTMSTSMMTRLSFCKSNVVESWYCDYGRLMRIPCNDSSINKLIALLCEALFLVAPPFIIVLSYVGIFLALCKITTWEGRFKALKTCVSHLLVVGSFFLPIICIMIAAPSANARIISGSLSFALPPMLNPIIYVLNTAKIKALIRKVLNNRSAPIRAKVSK
ncbi:olfactory receptor 1-like isoform X2 [Ctenopharyngodon idella]|uniref:olfactory receptor 1-like isoform X2 n=1 Tax=Ctenopharyngodon idella TaxID=7959 RepID=UPI00222E19BE|nr:olfactory receptor 1-like isoform X2 [Ctenopharyngodon idella]